MSEEHRIVVGVDGSESSIAALRWAIRQAKFTGARVDAVAVWRFPTGYGWAPARAKSTSRAMPRGRLPERLARSARWNQMSRSTLL